MKLRLFILSAIVITSTLFTNCKKKDKDPEPQPAPVTPTPSPLATLSTLSITSITETTAIGGGNVSSEGGSALTAVGICWDINTSPTTLAPHTNNGAGTGTYTSSITGLLPNTTYYVRAYATNGSGTAYGNEVSFKTNAAWINVNTTNYQFSDFTKIGTKIFGSSGLAVKVSTNNGGSWVNTGNNLPDNAAALYYNGTDLFASAIGLSAEGIYKSSNEGNSWTLVNGTGNVTSFTSLGSSMYAGSVGYGILKSSDNGNTWTVINSGLTNIKIKAMCTIGTTIFAGADNFGGPVCCFKSSDNGNSWTAANNGLPTPANVSSFAVISTTLFAVVNNKVYLSNDY